MASPLSAAEFKRSIDEVQRFLSVSLSIARAHTVDFYTRSVWSSFMSVSPEEVLRAVSSPPDHTGAAQGKLNSGRDVLAESHIAPYLLPI